MRVVAWNVAHGARECKPAPALIGAIAALEPDVLTLNEYVHGTSRVAFVASLADLGLVHQQCSERIGKNNQILVASRHPLRQGDLVGPEMAEHAGRCNFHHVHLDGMNVELVGVRAPAYERRSELRVYWEALHRVMDTARGRRIVFIGDFNADPDRRRYVGARYLAELESSGWKIPRPSGAWSCETKAGHRTRLDHVVVSPALACPVAAYVLELSDVPIVGRVPNAISDHAPLVVELTGS